MVTNLEHGLRICAAAATTQLPVLLGVTMRPISEGEGNFCLRDDEDSVSLQKVINAFLEVCPTIVCVNVMHMPVNECTPGLKAVRKHWSGPLGVYPNNVQSRFAESNSAQVSIPEFMVRVHEWIQCDATLIGGCCGIGVEYIAEIAKLQAEQ